MVSGTPAASNPSLEKAVIRRLKYPLQSIKGIYRKTLLQCPARLTYWGTRDKFISLCPIRVSFASF